MNYGDVIQQMMSLCDLEEGEIEDFGNRVPDSINRAITEIALSNGAVYGKYEFEIDDSEEDYIYIDMAKQKGFIDFADTPVLIERDGEETFRPFNNYDYEMGTTVVINPAEKGVYRIYYKKQHTLFTLDSEDSEELELPLRVQHLVAPLAGYYLLLPEDATLAVQLYNKYEQVAGMSVSTKDSRPRIRCEGGLDI